MHDASTPFHAHVYFDAGSRLAAQALHAQFRALRLGRGEPRIAFVGRLVDGPIGPHPEPQFEVHFFADGRQGAEALIRASGLRALIHPLTDDDLADHTTLGQWIGKPLVLDLSVLDPPGINQGVARFGISDF